METKGTCMNTNDTSRYQVGFTRVDLLCCTEPGGPAYRPIMYVVFDKSTRLIVGFNVLAGEREEE